jgi:beta-galactosidase
MTVKRAADTYIDTRGLHKGQMWVGSHNLGRFWTAAGPQFTLYTPGPWLMPGTTTLTFFDLMGDASDHLSTVDKPVFGASRTTREKQ